MGHLSSPETAERTLNYLHRRRAEHGEATASLQDIADALGVGRVTASRAVRRLTHDLAISVSRRGNGPLYPSCYRIHRPVNRELLERAERDYRARQTLAA